MQTISRRKNTAYKRLIGCEVVLRMGRVFFKENGIYNIASASTDTPRRAYYLWLPIQDTDPEYEAMQVVAALHGYDI